MDRKRKYRNFILFCLGLDLLAMGWLGFQYLDRKIPDEIHVSQESETNVSELLQRPFLTFEEAVPVSENGGYILTCRLLGMIPLKQVRVTPTAGQTVLVSGSAVGIYMETKGVLIIDTGQVLSETGEAQEPARDLVKPGDYIVGFNEKTVENKQELIDDLGEIDGEEVTLQLIRDGENIPVSVTPVKDAQGSYKLGIWVRDDTQGIGTLTFVDENGRYGALGHGISDVDTGELLNMESGSLYQAQILGIQKGSKGNPGELSGLIRYEPGQIIGNIEANSKNGIYGQLASGEVQALNGLTFRQMPVAYKQEVTEGEASILCAVDNEVKEYSAEITKIDMNHEDSNKSFVIRITDAELLEKTGGIVQGMSGSPVLQNGKLVGAITHVFVQDATSGYGIFAETMLEQ